MYDYKKALIPYPQKIEDRGERVLIAREGRPYYKLILQDVPSEVYSSAVTLLQEALDGFVMPVCDGSAAFVGENKCAGTFPITFGICSCAGDRADSYTIDIDNDGAKLYGYDAGGAYYAAVTFARLLSAENGKIYLPATKITDWPDFIDRGQFLEDRYGSDFMSFDEYKDAIKYLASMKYNQATIGVYGCWCVQYDNIISEYLYVPIKKYPELKTPRNIKYYSVADKKWVYKHDILPRMFQDDYFGDLVAYGKKHNIKVKPLFNSLGHNTLIPRVIPEISACDENGVPTGHGFCTRNEKTLEVMFDIYDEIIDRYLAPNGVDGFQLGLDEVSMDNFCKCDKCKGADPADLMIEYIIKICQHLKAKGMKSVYIYHDMLFKFGVINEATYQKFVDAGVADVAVIDWWSYRVDEKLFDGKELSNCFRGIIKPFNGYYHWAIPMEYNDSVYGCAKRAQKYGFEGIESYAGFEYSLDRPNQYQAELSWNISMLENREDFYDRYAYAFCPDDYEKAKEALGSMRDIMEALLSPNYMNSLEYYWYSYKGRKGSDYPTNFPGGVYSTILNNEATYLPYLKHVRAEAKKAIDFFRKNTKSVDFRNNTWLTVAMQYWTYADMYLTIVELYKNGADKYEIYNAFKRLLAQQEAFMLQSERTRIAGNLYHYQRNHSITRQFLLDMIAYIEESGDDFKFEITDFRYLRSDVFYAIR